MQQLAKLLNNETGLVQILGKVKNPYAYKGRGFEMLDVEKSDINGHWYLTGKCPKKTAEQKLNEAKEKKLAENEKVRNAFMLSGIEYKDVLFDSDDEQKINLKCTVDEMTDEETIEWTGKDGITKLLCTKADLIALGNLLKEKTAYVWSIKNPAVKSAILTAQTVEEVEAVEIEY